MFTGIISHIGKFEGYKNKCFVFQVKKSLAKKLKKEESIAIDGVCLTIEKKLGVRPLIQVSVMPETLKKSTLGELKSGDLVNLELPLLANGRIAGHIVQGHIDGVATVINVKKIKNSHIFSFKIPKKLSHYIVEKGSIAVNGISLTVIKAKDNIFSVGIIPYTWEHTILSQAKVGDRVNIEVDILAKYVGKLARGYLKR